MITTGFRCALKGFTVVRTSIAAWQRCGVRLGQARLQESCDPPAAFLPESVQLLAIAHQKTRESRHRSSAKYRQHEEQGHNRGGALGKSPVTPNLRSFFLQFAAVVSSVITNEAPQNQRFSLILAHKD